MKNKFERSELDIDYVDGRKICEGDILTWEDDDDEPVVCLVEWGPQKSAFCLRELDGSDHFCKNSYMRTCGRYRKIGSRYENEDLLRLWNRLGVDGDLHFNFFRQPKRDICFPVAALNACIGKGLYNPKTCNYHYLEKLIEIGECEKWGGCIDERLVLNEVQKLMNVTFAEADAESVLLEGGIITMKIGNGFHAAAVFKNSGDAYIVNSMMQKDQFVRPLLEGDSIPRSDDPAHHRDYLLLLN